MAEKPDEIKDPIWEKENIPNEALLYCYVYKTLVNIKTGKPIERAFRNTPFKTGTDLSTDWNKYSTPTETRERLAKHPKTSGGFKNPKDYFIVQLPVQKIRTEIPSQTVNHDPIQNDPIYPDNRSHTIIIGEEDTEIRLKFGGICEWSIEPHF